MFATFIQNLWQTLAISAPWLIFGLIIAGIIKAKVSNKWVAKHLSGNGSTPVIKGALIGAPLPLCSCSVIPVATQLHRSGASKGATAAFLVSTPETGVDSISLSYALLGPFMAVIRPISAVLSAIVTGLSISWFAKHNDTEAASNETVAASCCHEEAPKSSCCSTEKAEETDKEESCCGAEKQDDAPKMTLLQGVHYAFTQMLDDMKKWLFIGLVLSALVMTFIPNDFLLQYQNQWWIYLLVFVASFPVYICASASTPVAAGLMLAGLSPGATLIFMLAGPSTNVATLGILKQELGAQAMKLYVASLAVTSIALGVAVDWIAHDWQIDLHQQLMHHHEFLPGWVSAVSVIILFAFGIKAVRQKFLPTA
ncbi:SO_0444 family Cu/Zn efflux transporter [Hydrogenovibrio kuenenii]|uniref:SO_0444 family Cu/Zn efflux transporter n=1 Tax=Hydrogenovibrio kuenenii TaxID=63658 RepID=UPI000463F4FE|nr:SO_0444 family Cu/Zn efflux transporter [Hydrogenovibrio kuenenii]